MKKDKTLAYTSMRNFEENDERKVLEYVKERIEFNREDIEKIIEMTNSKYTYEQIVKIADEELEENTRYKEKKEWYMNENNVSKARVYMPIGYIGVETTDDLIALRYWLRALKSHNVIDVIDYKYDEHDLKNYLLTLLKIAYKNCSVNEEIIDRVAYEEAIDSEYDKMIYTEDDDENVLEEHKYNQIDITDKYYIYLQDASYENEANEEMKRLKAQNLSVEILKGSYEEIVQKLRKIRFKGAVIYTKDSKLAYNWINDIHSSNVFVNVSLINKSEECEEEELYILKTIAYPLPTNNEEEKNSTKSLIKVEENMSIIKRIQNAIRKLFGSK